jgi:hypothetical protein
VGRADESSGIISLGLFGLVVDLPRKIQVCAHRRRASEERSVNPGEIHHGDVLVEIG